jgi:hypothetical protein
LISEIRKLNDPYFEQFEGYPESCSESAVRWAKVMNTYATGIIPPTSGIPFGEMDMRGIILSICGNDRYDLFVTRFTSAVTQFTQQVASGIMPPTPLNLKPAFDYGMSGASGKEFAEKFAEIIDSWYRTGTARDTISNVVIFWS